MVPHKKRPWRIASHGSPAVPETFVSIIPEGPVVFRFPSVGIGKKLGHSKLYYKPPYPF